jgi:hypothetical protein
MAVGSRNAFANKTKNKIDTLSWILVKTAFHSSNRGKLNNRKRTTVLECLGRFNESHHSHQTPSNEKEIRFPIRTCPP